MGDDASTKKRSLKMDDSKGTISIGTASGNFRVDREEEKGPPSPKNISLYIITVAEKRERDTAHTQRKNNAARRNMYVPAQRERNARKLNISRLCYIIDQHRFVEN
jgi:hypothetical protein